MHCNAPTDILTKFSFNMYQFAGFPLLFFCHLSDFTFSLSFILFFLIKIRHIML